MREGSNVVVKGLKFSGGELSAAQLPRHPETWEQMQVVMGMRRPAGSCGMVSALAQAAALGGGGGLAQAGCLGTASQAAAGLACWPTGHDGGYDG